MGGLMTAQYIKFNKLPGPHQCPSPSSTHESCLPPSFSKAIVECRRELTENKTFVLIEYTLVNSLQRFLQE